MADDFRYDVFLSYSSKDKDVVRPLARPGALHVAPCFRGGLGTGGGLRHTMTTLRIHQEATGKNRHGIRLTLKRPAVMDIEAEAKIASTYYRRTLLR